MFAQHHPLAPAPSITSTVTIFTAAQPVLLRLRQPLGRCQKNNLRSEP